MRADVPALTSHSRYSGRIRGTLEPVTRRALTAPPTPAAPPCAFHAKEGAPQHGVAHLAQPLWPPAAHTRPPRRPPRRRHLRPLQGRHPAARRPQRPRAQPVRGKTHRTTRLHGPHALACPPDGAGRACALCRSSMAHRSVPGCSPFNHWPQRHRTRLSLGETHDHNAPRTQPALTCPPG